MAREKKFEMTEDHKVAIARGRSEAKAVKAYLEALGEAKARRSGRRSEETLKARLAAINDEMGDTDPLRKLQLIQERIDLEAQLADAGPDRASLEELEEQFIAVAAAYAGRKGVGYAAFRELGVSASVLQKAGMSRSGSVKSI